MIRAKEKKTSFKNCKQIQEPTPRNAELQQKEREKRKLVNCSAVNSAVQSKVRGGDDIYELPTLFILAVQRHEGEICDGEGVACFEGGHIYKGMFSKGFMHGRGVFTWACGLKFEGEFVSNVPMGQGTYTWPDGSSYKGEVYNGVRDGIGTFTCANNSVTYRGQWDQGKRHREGTVYYNQDKTSWYKGDWVKNNREGWGVRRYPSGNIYSGEWKNNLRHGEGTMKWIKLGEQYVGSWQNGVQHGQGTHMWILRRADGSQYTQSNQYTGDFVQGQRHGRGAFYYAGGAIYEGKWRNNRKHGKGKFTFKDGHVFEGEFVDDQMMTNNPNGNRAPTPLCGASPRPVSDSSSVWPDVALNIEHLLDLIPERNRDTERKQVKFVVLRQDEELKSIYSFYSRLGHAHSPDNTFLMSRLQLWRLLKDCHIHHHGATLTQIDHLIKEDATTEEIHSPFTPMPFRVFLRSLVTLAFHVYHKDMVSEKNHLAACFSKLLTDNILPNAMNVKGFLYRQPDQAFVAVNHIQKCWEIYQVYCKVRKAPRGDQTMTCRHLLWMFKDLNLLNDNLTTARLLESITAENPDPSNWSSCLDVEITFLEFFEVLLGSVQVKCPQASEGQVEGQSLEADEASEKLTTNSPSQSLGKLIDTAELSTSQELESEHDFTINTNEKPQSAEHTENPTSKQKGVSTRGMEAKGRELELWIQTIHQFFNHFFYPAFEHNQLVSSMMKQKKAHQKAP